MIAICAKLGILSFPKWDGKVRLNGGIKAVVIGIGDTVHFVRVPARGIYSCISIPSAAARILG